MTYARGIVVALILTLVAGCRKAAEAPAPVFGAGGVTQAAPAEPAPPPDVSRAGDSDRDGIKDARDEENAKQAPAEKPAPPEGKKAEPGTPNQSPLAATDPARKQPILIYRAEFSMSVYEVNKSLDAVEGLAKGYGGYLSRRDDRSITVRVPAEKFQDLVASIEKVGDVLHRNVVSEDVTAEYRDLEVQLANQLALRARFEKLLEKAVKVEEALSIERELGRITGEIERIKGRLKLLSDLSRYSTITVTFEPHSSQQLQQGPFVLPLPWLNQTGLKRLLQL